MTITDLVIQHQETPHCIYCGDEGVCTTGAPGEVTCQSCCTRLNRSIYCAPLAEPAVDKMTKTMKEHAALADRLFERTPHPGMDDPEPDYGFDKPLTEEK